MEHKFKLILIVPLLIVLYLCSAFAGEETDDIGILEEHGRFKRSSLGQFGAACDSSAWDKYVGPYLIVDTKMKSLPQGTMPTKDLQDEWNDKDRKLQEFKNKNTSKKEKLCSEDPKLQCKKNLCNCRSGPVPHNYVSVNKRCLALRGSSCKTDIDCANREDKCSSGYCGGYGAYIEASKNSPASRESLSGIGFALMILSIFI